MKLTLLENVNTQSFVLKHNILAQATSLAMGREGVLQTEKNLYLVLALVDNIIQENLIEEWLFEIAYERLKNLFINKFLQMLDEESEEEDLDKLLDELYDKICSSKSEIAKECEEIKYRMTHTFATNDERNEENLNRLLDLYEFIQDK